MPGNGQRTQPKGAAQQLPPAAARIAQGLAHTPAFGQRRQRAAQLLVQRLPGFAMPRVCLQPLLKLLLRLRIEIARTLARIPVDGLRDSCRHRAHGAVAR
jgi:hypothetical protein